MKDGREQERSLKDRTRRFALSVIELYSSLPRSEVARIMGRQLLRSGTSVGAHYREGTRARSDAEFISKMEGALQELEETMYWLELLEGSGICSLDEVKAVVREADELTGILVTIVKRVKERGGRQR